MFKVSFQGKKNPQKYKNPHNIIPYMVWDFLLDIVDAV